MTKEYRVWKRLKNGKVLVGSWHNDVTQAIHAWADCVEAHPDVIDTGFEVREQPDDELALSEP